MSARPGDFSVLRGQKYLIGYGVVKCESLNVLDSGHDVQFRSWRENGVGRRWRHNASATELSPIVASIPYARRKPVPSAHRKFDYHEELYSDKETGQEVILLHEYSKRCFKQLGFLLFSYLANQPPTRGSTPGEEVAPHSRLTLGCTCLEAAMGDYTWQPYQTL